MISFKTRLRRIIQGKWSGDVEEVVELLEKSNPARFHFLTHMFKQEGGRKKR